MFWNKKELAEIENLHRVILVNIEKYNQSKKLTNSKLDLILDHLKLKYVPETETKEQAKLVDNTVSLGINWGTLLHSMVDDATHVPTATSKKRDRPKKK